MQVDRLERFHHAIVEHTHVVTVESSDSVLGLGQALSNVLLGALAIDKAMTALVDDDEAGLPPQNATLATVLADPLTTAGSLTEQVSVAVAQVGAACEHLNHITSMCQILLMHTRIEGDRIARSNSVHATSEQLSSFTQQMVEATIQADSVHYDLASLVGQLGHALAKMQGVINGFSEGLTRRLVLQRRTQVRASEQFRGSIKTIHGLSRQIVMRSKAGVDALQFHDVGIQSLQRLDSLFADLLGVAGAPANPEKWSRRLGDLAPSGTATAEETLLRGIWKFHQDAKIKATDFLRDSESAVIVVVEVIDDLTTLAQSQALASRQAITNADVTDQLTPFLNSQLRELDTLTQQYLSLAVEGKGLCDSLLDVQRKISLVARRVEPPAQNLSLQASKSGKEGRPLAVIADEMVSVSRQVAQVGQRVVEAANIVRGLLPELEQTARTIAQLTNDEVLAIRTVADQLAERTSDRSTELRKSLQTVQQLALQVREAQWSVTSRGSFVDAIRKPLTELMAIGDEAWAEVAGDRDAPPPDAPKAASNPDVDVASDDDGDDLSWMFDPEPDDDETGELILL